jgi:hypothetical protein
VIEEERIYRVPLDKNQSWDYGRKLVKRKGKTLRKERVFVGYIPHG